MWAQAHTAKLNQKLSHSNFAATQDAAPVVLRHSTLNFMSAAKPVFRASVCSTLGSGVWPRTTSDATSPIPRKSVPQTWPIFIVTQSSFAGSQNSVIARCLSHTRNARFRSARLQGGDIYIGISPFLSARRSLLPKSQRRRLQGVT
jgi:hypothetical protein